MTAAITRPALRYYGGKWRIAPWIIRHFPAHQCYVEPFGGAASVLLRKPPAPFEVLNDLDSSLVTFFRVLRDRPDALTRAIELTPWSREELTASYAAGDCDDVERARRLYVQLWQAWHGHGNEQSSGWRYQRANSRRKGKSDVAEWGNITHLYAIASRLKRVQIEHDDARAVINRFDAATTLFYVDPPYVSATRSRATRRAGRYTHEMTDADHAALAETLRTVQGMVMLSGYPSPLYDRLYAGWERQEMWTTDNGANRCREALWLSPRTVAALAQRSLFDTAAAAQPCTIGQGVTFSVDWHPSS